MNAVPTAVTDLLPPADVRAGTLHGRLVVELRRLVNEGDLEPDSRVNEKDLCERFGVSRTPLREALKALAAEGLIVLLPRRGARVAALDETQLRNVFEVVAALEAEAGRLACRRMSDAELAEIEVLHYQMKAHYLREDLPAYFVANQKIHSAIVAAAGNPVLALTHAGLAGRITRARYLANRLDNARWHAAVGEHAAILDALRARDEGRLATMLHDHLINKRDAVLGQLNVRAGQAASVTARVDRPDID